MIAAVASLPLTIVLMCETPRYVVAERGGQAHAYEIRDYVEDRGRLQYWVGDQPNKEFLAGVEMDMRIRHLRPDVRNYGEGCRSL